MRFPTQNIDLDLEKKLNKDKKSMTVFVMRFHVLFSCMSNLHLRRCVMVNFLVDLYKPPSNLIISEVRNEANLCW